MVTPLDFLQMAALLDFLQMAALLDFLKMAALLDFLQMAAPCQPGLRLLLPNSPAKHNVGI